MRKKSFAYHLIVISVFFGILLSLTITHVSNMLLASDSTLASQCYDGTVIEGNSPHDAFGRAVYQNKTALSFIRKMQYRMFGSVSSPSVLAGKNDFLFERYDESYDYDYLQDYTGECRFTEQEHAAILSELSRRKAFCQENGAQYMLVVLPNAQSVYSEYMPTYLGGISRNTRLSALADYLSDNSFYSFAELTDSMRSHKAEGLLYNNTENSMNALGLYYTYEEICRRIPPSVMGTTQIVARNDLEFYQHLTTGKATARKAGLEDVVQNRSVSLSNSTALHYQFTYTSGPFATTMSPGLDGKTPNILLQFSNNWERLQSEVFFSNTFSKVTYQTDLTLDKIAMHTARPHMVV